MANQIMRKTAKANPARFTLCLLALLLLTTAMSTATLAATPGADVSPEPGWITLLPPVIAISIALIFRSVIPALFIGIWGGALILIGPGLFSWWTSFLKSFDTYLVNAIANPDRVRVLLFTMMLGGMIGILARNGGMQGIVVRVTRLTSNAVRGQLVTASLGIVIFFDDIANTLLIGKTMRPVMDKLAISREKLAYIVDSTAAPVAGIAFASTWVGFEVSVIGSTIESVPDLNTSPYLIFLASVPYSFYPIITVFMVFAVAWTARDFGPMYEAEVAARSSKAQFEAAETNLESSSSATGDSHKASNAIIPIVIVVLTLFASLLVTGSGDTLRDILSSADSYLALMWASLLGAASAAIITVYRKILSVNQVIDVWSDGVGSTLFAVIVLVLSWTLADIVQLLGTAEYIIAIASGNLPLYLLPTLSFLLSGIVAFTTGTSWGTLGIIMPLILPLSWSLLTGSSDYAVIDQMYLFHGSIGGVLAGAIFGDHCSPISDTTVLSSLASDCDHIDHVRTQLPYALTSGFIAIVLCTLPVGFGIPWWICLPVSFVAVYTILKTLGKSTDVTTAVS